MECAEKKALVLEQNMGIIKEMLTTLPHFQECTRSLERDSEHIREANKALVLENRAHLLKIDDLEQSNASLKQENEVLRVKLAQSEAQIRKLRSGEGSEEALKQLANEVKSCKAR